MPLLKGLICPVVLCKLSSIPGCCELLCVEWEERKSAPSFRPVLCGKARSERRSMAGA